MKATRMLAFFGVVTLLATSHLGLVSPVSAASTSFANPKVEKVPGPDFQPATYFASQRAAYQQDKAAHPEKYAEMANKSPEWFFTGKPYDADSKSYLFLFRNYRPDSASWITPDPAGFPDGPNNYAYAPVPTIQIDPLGLTISLDAYDTWQGIEERCLLYEIRNPGSSGYIAGGSKTGMQLLDAVIWNRKDWSGPNSTFGYTGGVDMSTVTTTRSAFPEFSLNGSGVAVISSSAQAVIDNILTIANTGSPGKYYNFVQNALDITNGPVNDPFTGLTTIGTQKVRGSTWGMTTAGSSAGGSFVAIPSSISPGGIHGGNQFYTLAE